MAFPNVPWQEEQDAPRWHPVAGKPNIYTHDDRPTCEVEILYVRCRNCGPVSDTLIMHAVCDCEDHRSDLSRDERHEIHARCRSCGRQCEPHAPPE